MTSNEWPTERIGRLTALFHDARCLSRRQIAEALGEGLTRQAVIGKLYRLGLTRAEGKPVRGPDKVPRRPRLQRQAPNVPRDTVDPAAPPPKPRRLNLFALTATTCRWPLWSDNPTDSEPRVFCGRHAAEGRYCGFHTAAAHKKTPQRTRGEFEIERRRHLAAGKAVRA